MSVNLKHEAQLKQEQTEKNNKKTKRCNMDKKKQEST